MGQPEKRFKAGGCVATVFVNMRGDGADAVEVRSVALQRTYKDREGRFQHTTSLNPGDVPKAILALTRAYYYLMTEQTDRGAAR